METEALAARLRVNVKGFVVRAPPAELAQHRVRVGGVNTCEGEVGGGIDGGRSRGEVRVGVSLTT